MGNVINSVPKKHIEHLVMLSALTGCLFSPLLLANYGIDQAKFENVDTSKWRCKFCPDEEGLSGSAEGYFGYSDEDISQRFKNTGAEGEEGQLSVSADVLNRSSEDQTRYILQGIGDDNALAGVSYQDNASLRADVIYSRSNHFFGEGAQTIYPDPHTDTLELPGGWLPQNTTGSMDFSTLYPVNNYLQRETLETGARNRFGKDAWELAVHFRQQERSGTDWKSGSILNQVTALPAVRNDQLRELTLTASAPIELQNGKLNVGLEYFRSVYDNDYQSLSWENPFIPAIAGAEQGQLSDAPDNLFRRWRLFANYQREQHQFDVSYSQGKGEQDQDYLPYSTNTLLVTQPLPSENYGGEVNTRHARIRWNYLIDSTWQLKTRYRFNERDNVSERLSFEPVMTDSLLQGIVQNQRLSHRKSELDVNLDWRLRSQTRFGYGYEFQHYSRKRDSNGEYASHGLSFYWAERWTSNLKTRTTLAAEERDEKNHQAVPGENPLYRDFTVADRLRNRVGLDLDWQCTDHLQLSANAAYHEDDFENTQIGVSESEEKTLGLNLSWQVNKYLSGNASVQRSWINWMMAGSSQQSFPSWRSTQEDQYDVLSLGIRQSGLLNDTVTLGVDYRFVNSQGDTDLGQTNQYDSQEYEGHSLLSYLSYQWRPEWTLRVEALYERYQSDYPSLLAVNSLTRVIGNAIEDDNEADWLVGLRLQYQIAE